MNLIEALRQQRNLRRPIARHLGSEGNGWLSWSWVLGMLTEANKTELITPTDVLADDWETRESAVARLQARISEMVCKTGIHPTVLDVPEEDLRELESCNKSWGFGGNCFELHHTSGRVRLVKARK